MKEATDPIFSNLREVVESCICESLTAGCSTTDPLRFFQSGACLPLKQEIVRNGLKLWERQYVDGNGGNISARISPRHVICTPTMLSKADVRVQDLCLVNLENELLWGELPQTSEIRLHLEIYKTVPQARAVIHCHPPHATAFAVAGMTPQGNLLPEQEVFVGPVALSPYETPGTQAFAETVIPFVRTHNTVLLANHGIVSWADTITHAEWYVEVIETYCRTVTLAQQLRGRLAEFPPNKIAELLRIKEKLGLPDERLGAQESSVEPSFADDTVFPDLLNRKDPMKSAHLPNNEDVSRLTESIEKLVREFIARHR